MPDQKQTLNIGKHTSFQLSSTVARVSHMKRNIFVIYEEFRAGCNCNYNGLYNYLIVFATLLLLLSLLGYRLKK